jgi:hypothetical protein
MASPSLLGSSEVSKPDKKSKQFLSCTYNHNPANLKKARHIKLGVLADPARYDQG